MLEQFYTGEIMFPPINGVDEGSILISLLSIWSGYYGNHMWRNTIIIPYINREVSYGWFAINLI